MVVVLLQEPEVRADDPGRRRAADNPVRCHLSAR
jgi:hypothetical protein